MPKPSGPNPLGNRKTSKTIEHIPQKVWKKFTKIPQPDWDRVSLPDPDKPKLRPKGGTIRKP